MELYSPKERPLIHSGVLKKMMIRIHHLSQSKQPNHNQYDNYVQSLLSITRWFRCGKLGFQQNISHTNLFFGNMIRMKQYMKITIIHFKEYWKETKTSDGWNLRKSIRYDKHIPIMSGKVS